MATKWGQCDRTRAETKLVDRVHRATIVYLLMQEHRQQQPPQDAPYPSHAPERDAEAEQELTEAARSDPFAAYDVDVTLEGQAIREYLAMLGDSDAAG